MARKKYIYKQVEEEAVSSYCSDTPEELIDKINKVVASVIAKGAQKESIRFSVHTEEYYPGDSSSALYVSYQRLETDVEHESRIKSEERNRKLREDNEMREYERLQKIYGKTNNKSAN